MTVECAVCDVEISHLDANTQKKHLFSCTSAFIKNKSSPLPCPSCLEDFEKKNFLQHFRRCFVRKKQPLTGSLRFLVDMVDSKLLGDPPAKKRSKLGRNVNKKRQPKKVTGHQKIRESIISELRDHFEFNMPISSHSSNVITGEYGSNVSITSLWEQSTIKSKSNDSLVAATGPSAPSTPVNEQSGFLNDPLESPFKNSMISHCLNCDYLDNYLKFLDPEMAHLCDVELICSDGSVPAVKAILELNVEQSNFDVSQYSIESVRLAMEFVYTARIGNHDLSLEELNELLKLSKTMNFFRFQWYINGRLSKYGSEIYQQLKADGIKTNWKESDEIVDSLANDFDCRKHDDNICDDHDSQKNIDANSDLSVEEINQIACNTSYDSKLLPFMEFNCNQTPNSLKCSSSLISSPSECDRLSIGNSGENTKKSNTLLFTDAEQLISEKLSPECKNQSTDISLFSTNSLNHDIYDKDFSANFSCKGTELFDHDISSSTLFKTKAHLFSTPLHNAQNENLCEISASMIAEDSPLKANLSTCAIETRSASKRKSQFLESKKLNNNGTNQISDSSPIPPNYDASTDKYVTPRKDSITNYTLREITPYPNYSFMDTPHLVEECEKFGVRKLKKNQMVKTLVGIYDHTHQEYGKPKRKSPSPANRKSKKSKPQPRKKAKEENVNKSEPIKKRSKKTKSM